MDMNTWEEDEAEGRERGCHMSPRVRDCAMPESVSTAHHPPLITYCIHLHSFGPPSFLQPLQAKALSKPSRPARMLAGQHQLGPAGSGGDDSVSQAELLSRELAESNTSNVMIAQLMFSPTNALQ